MKVHKLSFLTVNQQRQSRDKTLKAKNMKNIAVAVHISYSYVCSR